MKTIITLDGSSGVGKGTIAMLLAKKLGWHLLDSGALYRVLALAAQQNALEFDNEAALSEMASHLDVDFRPEEDGVKVYLKGEDVTQALRLEETANLASKVAIFPKVRAALLQYQQDAYQSPGLVADGRDMGTVVFADAPAKFFLTANATARAKRRYKQLKQKGNNANLADLEQTLIERDKRDSERKVAPLLAASDAKCIDTSLLSVDEVFDCVWQALPAAFRVQD